MRIPNWSPWRSRIIAHQTVVQSVITAIGIVVIALWMRHHWALHGWEGIDAWSFHIGVWEWVHHQPMTVNPAAWNGSALHRRWVNVEWGWQAILAAVGYQPRLWTFLAACMAGLLATAWWAWKPLASTRGRPWGAVAGAFGILLVTQQVLWTFRPMLVSFSLWAVLIGITVRMHRDARWAWGIIPITIIWANLHGDFLLAFAWLGFEGAWALVGRWRPTWLDTPRPSGFGWTIVGTGIGSVLGVVLATPNHLATLTYSLWLSSQSWIHRYIVEWQPLSLAMHPFDFFGIAVALAVIIRLLIHPWRPDQIPWFLWSCIIFSASLVHQRFLPYIGVPLAGLWWSGWKNVKDSSDSPPTFLRWLPAGIIGGMTIAVLTFGHPPWTGYTRTARTLHSTAQWLIQHPRPGALYMEPNSGILEQFGVRHLYTDGRYGLFLRDAPARLWLVIAWQYPHQGLADNHLVADRIFHHPVHGWTAAAQATQALHGLMTTGVTRWIPSAPVSFADRQALRHARWTATALPTGLIVWQAPPSTSTTAKGRPHHG